MTDVESLKTMARFVVRNFELSPNLVKNIVAARMDRDWDWLDELVAEAYLNEVENLAEIHEHSNEGKHYCINIKVHSLPLTNEQVSFLLDPEKGLLQHFQETYIRPWMVERNYFSKPDVLVKGRSGGWLCLDRKVYDSSPAGAHRAEAYDAEKTYEEVKEFREEWDTLFEEMKRELDRIVQKEVIK